MDSLIKQKLKQNLKGVRFDECMKKHCSMKAGGKASAFVCVKEAAHLQKAIKVAKELGIDYKVLGNGSNIIVRDGGYDGLIIALGKLFGGGSKQGTTAKFGAGMPMFAVGIFCSLNDLAGLEWAFGIPGTVGGACYMNAGAYGHEWAQFVRELEVLDGDQIKTLQKGEFWFGYRDSSIKQNKQIVISCTLNLFEGKCKQIEQMQANFLSQRKAKQPLEFPSCGSVFKREENFFPSKAIDELGLKGAKVGDAEVSKKHAGFIINKKNATCQQIETLIQLIKDKVLEAHGVVLHEEIEFLGNKN